MSKKLRIIVLFGHFRGIFGQIMHICDFRVSTHLRWNVKMSKMDELSSYSSHFVAFRPDNTRFFDFRVSTHLKYNVKMSKWAKYRLIWAISWHFGLIMCVFWFSSFESSEIKCQNVQNGHIIILFEHFRGVSTRYCTFCGISSKSLAKNLRRIENFVLWDNHSSVV